MFIWRSLIEKNLEWNIHIFGLDGDVFKAYDSTSHWLLIRALRRKGIHDIIIAAWLREVRRASSKVKLDAWTTSPELLRTRSLFQGDPAAPVLFNASLDEVVSSFHRRCQFEKWGIEIETGTYLGIFCYADNYWLVATSASMLQSMLATWLLLLGEAGFHTPPDELTWCTTAPDELDLQVTYQERSVARSPRAIGFKVLGSRITFNTSCEADLVCRIDKAWRAFYCHIDILCCKHVSFGRRLQYLESFVAKVLFWGARTWKLTEIQLDKMNGVQLRMMRKMLGARRCESQSVGDYCRDVNSRIRQLLHQHKTLKWASQQLKLHFLWMGRLARFQITDPDRWTYRIFCYKDLRYVASLQKRFGNQTHGRRFHAWRLEWDIHKFLGPEWRTLA